MRIFGITLSDADLWLLGICGSLVVLWFGYRFKIAILNRNALRVASADFRSSINTDMFNGLTGHQLHGALLKSLTAIKSAVYEFRFYLGFSDRLRMNHAWKKYHGGDEEHPDFFKMYCITEHGPALLKERLEKLRSIGNKK